MAVGGERRGGARGGGEPAARPLAASTRASGRDTLARRKPGDQAEPSPGVSAAVAHPGRARRLGLYGGSFDPVHAGHLHVARAAHAARALERVLFVPAARPPHKPGRELAPAEHRLAMLEIALAHEPAFALDARELSRPGPSYTIDTLRAIEAEQGGPQAVELYLILGSDNLAGLAGWRALAELLRRAQPVVVPRAGDPPGLPARLRRALGPELCERLERGFLSCAPVEVAACELRAALACGEDPGPALPPGVLEYVRAHGLYRA